MKLSVSHKVYSVALVAVIALAASLFVTFREFNAIHVNNDRVLLLASTLQTQQFADMMHDALRGDAIAALLAAQHEDTQMLADVKKDYDEHAAAIRAKMEENRPGPWIMPSRVTSPRSPAPSKRTSRWWGKSS